MTDVERRADNLLGVATGDSSRQARWPFGRVVDRRPRSWSRRRGWGQLQSRQARLCPEAVVQAGFRAARGMARVARTTPALPCATSPPTPTCTSQGHTRDGGGVDRDRDRRAARAAREPARRRETACALPRRSRPSGAAEAAPRTRGQIRPPERRRDVTRFAHRREAFRRYRAIPPRKPAKRPRGTTRLASRRSRHRDTRRHDVVSMGQRPPAVPVHRRLALDRR
jgi:hypothetical protein